MFAPSSSVPTTTDPGVVTLLEGLHAKVDMVTALQKQMMTMEASQQFLADKYEELKDVTKQQAEQIKVLQRQMTTRAAPPPVPETEQNAIVISGMEETETETEPTERVAEIIHNTMELPSVSVVSVVRLGKQPTEGRPRKLLVKLGSQKEAVEVLTSARRLSQLNIERKSNSEIPIGIDRNLSPAELQHRSSVWAAFKAAKAGGKQCRWRLGYRLYIDGSEVLPGSPA